MNRRESVFWLLLAAALAAGSVTAFPADARTPGCCRQTAAVRPDFDDDLLGSFESTAAERSAEEQGKVTVRIHDTGRATMKVVQSETMVQAPAAAVWDVIVDYDYYPKLFDHMERSETTLKQGDWEHHYTVVRYPWPWGSRWVLNTIHHDRPRLVARFKRLEGTIREVEGRWELREPSPGKTVLRYGVRMDPGLEFIPTWVVPWATRIVVPDILRSVAREAESRRARSPKPPSVTTSFRRRGSGTP